MKKILFFLFTKSIGIYLNILSLIWPEKALQLAYALFSEPREGRLFKNKLPAILKEAQTNTLQHDNHFFQTYTWKGNETIVLLVHGWESNASRWENLLPHLKKSGSTILDFGFVADKNSPKIGT